MEHSSGDVMALGTAIVLGFVVIPVWMLAGLADYFCHRASHIERNAGTVESLLHLLQFGLVGLPLAAALFLQIDVGLLALMVLFIGLHHAVAFVDVRYANERRVVSPVEQMVHSFLELLPIAAFLLLCALEFSQVKAAFGVGAERADFALRLRDVPLPAWYILSVLIGAAIIDFLPYAEELQRCIRTPRDNLSSVEVERHQLPRSR